MSWGTRRRNTILFILFVCIVGPAIAMAIIIFYEPPTCFDTIQNGKETGVDCGGECQLLCTNQVTTPVVMWERVFRVQDGMYNLLAYIENPNPHAFLRDASYVFKMYNEDNVLIGEKTGVVSIAPKATRPIIQNNIQTFEQIPARTTFEFIGDLVYEQSQPEDSLILIKDEIIENESTNPKVKAIVQNISLHAIEDIDIIVMVYDVFDNVLNTSSTYIDSLEPESSKNIVFTWPKPFMEDVARIELIPIYDFE